MAMKNPDQDLQELVFGDALRHTPEAELQAISNHPQRSEELARLLQLREMLLSLNAEEPPRRTVLAAPVPAETGLAQPGAFSFAAWLRGAFGAPGWGLAAACALAGAIVFHALWTQPGPAPDPAALASVEMGVQQESTLQASASEAVRIADTPDVEAMIEARVASAVAAMREEMAVAQESETLRLVAATEERLRAEHEQEMLEVREAVYFMKKQFGRQLVANVALASEVQ
jgi:hypothetical protein